MPPLPSLTNGRINGTFTDPNNQVRISENSNAITLNLAGMTFKTSYDSSGPSAPLQAHYHYDNQNQPFQYQTETITVAAAYGSTSSTTTYYWHDASMHTWIDIKFPLTFIISGEGAGQTIQLGVSDPSVSIDGSVDASGPCKCGDGDVQNSFRSQLRTQLPKQISTQLGNMKFTAISIFVLENLLFPSKTYIRMGNSAS